MPGMMDLHSHVFLHPYNETLWNDEVLKEPVAYRAVAGDPSKKNEEARKVTFVMKNGVIYKRP